MIDKNSANSTKDIVREHQEQETNAITVHLIEENKPGFAHKTEGLRSLMLQNLYLCKMVSAPKSAISMHGYSFFRDYSGAHVAGGISTFSLISPIRIRCRVFVFVAWLP